MERDQDVSGQDTTESAFYHRVEYDALKFRGIIQKRLNTAQNQIQTTL